MEGRVVAGCREDCTILVLHINASNTEVRGVRGIHDVHGASCHAYLESTIATALILHIKAWGISDSSTIVLFQSRC